MIEAVRETIDKWLSILPPICASSSASTEHFPLEDSPDISPLSRCLLREIRRGRQILSAIHHDLNTTFMFCDGNVKATNQILNNVYHFSKEIVPPHWQLHYNETGTGVLSASAWVVAVAAKIQSLDRYSALIANKIMLSDCPVWLGGFFSPEAFITATRQYVAEKMQWSIEELELELCIGKATATSIQDVVIEKMYLEGATVSGTSIGISMDLRTALPSSTITWKLRGSIPDGAISFPLYTSDNRTKLAVKVHLLPPPGIPHTVWAQRGVAFLISASDV